MTPVSSPSHMALPRISRTRRVLRQLGLIRARHRAILALGLALTVLATAGCKGGAGPAKKGKGSGRRAAAKTQELQKALSAGLGGAVLTAADYVPASGYVVKGTDFLTFWPCGKEGYYFLKAQQSVNARIAQEYKFAAPRPYTTMYADLKVRFVDDTIAVGDRKFPRYVDVSSFTPASRTNGKCEAPARAVLSSEMQRLDNFRVSR